jgi:ATP phosphoribosyltransferase
LTAGVFKKAAIIFSYGATEALVEVVSRIHPLVYGVGVVETGVSLQENSLRIAKVIMESPVVFIAKKKTPELEIFGRILAGALESEKILSSQIQLRRGFGQT